MEIVTKYYLEYITVFKENFIKVLYNFDPDAVHKMRTSTKRLRALFLLIQFLSSEKFKAKKQLKNIRRIFKLAGRIREIQVEQLLVYELEERMNQNFVEYNEYLLIKEHKSIAEFLKCLPDVERRSNVFNEELIFNIIKSIDSTDMKAKSKKFLLKKTAFITKLNRKKTSNDKIHKNRTVLKQIYYLYDILSNLTGNIKLLKLSKIELRELEQQIGNWHDRVNSFHFLTAFLKTKEGRIFAKYKLLKQQVVVDRDKMRSELLKVLRKEIFP
ncbi:MAG: CHAD domain-containing protein [Bacteroidales bacterium]|nr:CHAD domain-containing protein [Bacteroidales bacterium]